MKRTILKLTVTGLIVIANLAASAQQNKKAESARKDVAEAQKDLNTAKADSAADYQAFRKEARLKIAGNQRKIVELRAKKASDNKEIKEKYDQQVLSLEKKNNELKEKMNGAGNTSAGKWTSFKREFNHDMDELGNAFRDIGRTL